MKTTLPKDPGADRAWYLVDAQDMPLGRLAVKIAGMLRGKNKVSFSPQVDQGDFVVVINAAKVKLTGRKNESKIYQRFSGFRSGLKEIPAAVTAVSFCAASRQDSRPPAIRIKGVVFFMINDGWMPSVGGRISHVRARMSIGKGKTAITSNIARPTSNGGSLGGVAIKGGFHFFSICLDEA